jgi:hypothetical protein
MKRILSAAAVLSMFAALGCSNAMTRPQAASDAAAEKSAETPAAAKAEEKAPAADDVDSQIASADAKADAKADADKADAPAADKALPEKASAAEPAEAKPVSAPWAAGDFVVYRFSGSFHKTAATLTEKVIERKGELFTLEITYDDGSAKDTIRAHMKGDSPARADVVSVARLSHGKEQKAAASLYDEIMARVALAADQNEATLGAEKVKMDVAGLGATACERATYRVKVGKQTATMKTVASPAFVWGDVAAEITAANGKLLYKAEVVDAGHASTKAPAVASADDDY